VVQRAWGLTLRSRRPARKAAQAPQLHVRTLGSFMSLRAASIGHLQAHQAATPVVIGSSPCTFVGCRSMRVAGRFVVSAQVRVFTRAQPSLVALSRQPFVRVSFRHAPVQVQPVAFSPVVHSAIANAYQRSVSLATEPFVLQNTTEKTVPTSTIVLTRRSTSLPSVAGRCAIEPRSAG
jgi:hypothetical protein